MIIQTHIEREVIQEHSEAEICIFENYDDRDIEIALLESELGYSNIIQTAIIAKTPLMITEACNGTDNIMKSLNESTSLLEAEDNKFWKTLMVWAEKVRGWFETLLTTVKEKIIEKLLGDAKWVSDNKMSIKTGLSKYSSLSSDERKKLDAMESFSSATHQAVDKADTVIGDGLQAMMQNKFNVEHTTNLTTEITNFNNAKEDKETNKFKQTVTDGISYFSNNIAKSVKSTVDKATKEFESRHDELTKAIRMEDKAVMSSVKANKKLVDSFIAKTLSFNTSSNRQLSANYMTFLKAAMKLNQQ